MRVILSGDDQVMIRQPVRNVPQAMPVILVKPIPEKAAELTTEDKIKKFVTWGSLGLLIYKLLRI